MFIQSATFKLLSHKKHIGSKEHLKILEVFLKNNIFSKFEKYYIENKVQILINHQLLYNFILLVQIRDSFKNLKKHKHKKNYPYFTPILIIQIFVTLYKYSSLYMSNHIHIKSSGWIDNESINTSKFWGLPVDVCWDTEDAAVCISTGVPDSKLCGTSCWGTCCKKYTTCKSYLTNSVSNWVVYQGP